MNRTFLPIELSKMMQIFTRDKLKQMLFPPAEKKSNETVWCRSDFIEPELACNFTHSRLFYLSLILLR